MTETSTFEIQTQHEGAAPGVVTVWLQQGDSPVVVLDEHVIAKLDRTLADIPDGAMGLVLASRAPRAFVAGADLKSIRPADEGGLSDEQLHKYLEFGARVFGRLHNFPFPTCAAINGAALGGGLELAMHCDGLIGAPPPERDGQPGKPYPVGLPEAGLSICPGWGGTNLLPARIDPSEAIKMTCSGVPVKFDKAVELGMFDQVAPNAESLIETSINWIITQREQGATKRDGAPAKWIGRPGITKTVQEAYDEYETDGAGEPARAVLDAVDTGLVGAGGPDGWHRALQSERDSLVRLRARPAGREAIRAFFDKTTAKA